MSSLMIAGCPLSARNSGDSFWMSGSPWNSGIREWSDWSGGRAEGHPRPVRHGPVLPGRPAADPGQSKGKAVVHLGGRNRECPRHNTHWANCSWSEDPEVHDPEEGLRWLRRAAQEGSTYAAYRLGKEYLTGEHAPKSGENAVRCFRSSAEQGNPFAQYMLGKLYLDGEALPRDPGAGGTVVPAVSRTGKPVCPVLPGPAERPPAAGVMLSVTRLLHHLSRVFQENSMPATSPGVLQIDRKRLLQLREKRIALGHKADDHPEQGWGGMSMGGM